MTDESASEHDETCGCVYCRDARWAEDRAEDGVEMGAMIQVTTGTTPKDRLPEYVSSAVRRLLLAYPKIDLETVRFEVFHDDGVSSDVDVIGHLRKASS